MVFSERFTAEIFVKFLERLVKHQAQKVYLILDRYSVHRARKVQKWAAAHKERLQIFYLPPYSPELNPDELLNQDLKANALRSRRPSSKEELLSKVRGFLRSKQKQPAKVSRYFDGKYVQYARAA